MLFSYSDFEKTKKLLVEEFNKIPVQVIEQPDQPYNYHEYNKILNALRYAKHRKTKTQCSSRRLQSATSSLKVRFEQIYPQQSFEGFYLTEAHETIKSNLSVEPNDSFFLSSLAIDINDEKEKLVMLAVQASEEKEKQKNYQKEINELEASVRSLKKKSHEMEEYISRGSRKQVNMINQALKRQSTVNFIAFRNNQLKQQFASTERFFHKSLRNVEASKKTWSKKTLQMTDELVEAILIKNNLKEQVSEQNSQINSLEETKKQIRGKLQDFRKILKKSQSLRMINSLITFIKEHSYGKSKRLSKFLQEQKKQCGLEESFEDFNFAKISRDIIRVYKKMKFDAEKLQSIYELKIDDHNEKLKILKELQERKQCQVIEAQAVNTDEQSSESEDKIEKKIKQIRMICEGLVQMDDRCRFFVKKWIKYLQRITENWLRFDQSAINFASTAIDSFLKIHQQKDQLVVFSRAKELLMAHFENWQKYLFFIEEIEENAILSRSLSKEVISTLFRRIIKTKMQYRDIPTQNIFQSCITKCFDDKIGECFSHIVQYLRVAVSIYNYSSKYQVLIVNSIDKLTPVEDRDRRSEDKYHEGSEHVSQNPSKGSINRKKQWAEKGEGKAGVQVPKISDLILTYQEEIKKVNRTKISLRLN